MLRPKVLDWIGRIHHLFKANNTRYVSIAGKPNSTQPALIRSVFEKMPLNSKIVLAMDNDKGGHDIAKQITEIL